MSATAWVGVAGIAVTVIVTGFGAIWQLGRALGRIEISIGAVDDKVEDVKGNHLKHIYDDIRIIKSYLLGIKED